MVQPLASEAPAPTLDSLPGFMKERLHSNEEALQMTVRSGTRIGSGFATSEACPKATPAKASRNAARTALMLFRSARG